MSNNWRQKLGCILLVCELSGKQHSGGRRVVYQTDHTAWYYAEERKESPYM
jgi:hypothetical protein